MTKKQDDDKTVDTTKTDTTTDQTDTTIDTTTDIKTDATTGITPPDLDHKERSELGRKVKAQAEEIASLKAGIEVLLERTTPKEEPIDPFFSSWEPPQTPEEFQAELEKYIRKREEALTKAEKAYSDNYMGAIYSFKGDENYAEICDEVQKNFSIRHSDSGKVDARMNYQAAENAVLKRKLSGNSPLKGKKDNLPLGTGGGDTQIEEEAVMPKLDKDAMAYIEATGKTAEEVIKIMKKPLPLGIGGLG